MSLACARRCRASAAPGRRSGSVGRTCPQPTPLRQLRCAAMPARALVFDFNGTLSDDEDVMERSTAEVLGRYGRAPTHREYIDRLAGLSDEAMARTWLGDRPDIDEIVGQRIEAYRSRIDGGRTIGPGMREV